MLRCLVLVLGSAVSASTLVFGSRLLLCVPGASKDRKKSQGSENHIGWQFWRVYGPWNKTYHVSAAPCKILLYSVQILMAARHWWCTWSAPEGVQSFTGACDAPYASCPRSSPSKRHIHPENDPCPATRNPINVLSCTWVVASSLRSPSGTTVEPQAHGIWHETGDFPSLSVYSLALQGS